MSEQATKPAIDPSPANPLWVFVCYGQETTEAYLKDAEKNPTMWDAKVVDRLRHEREMWVALVGLVDRWLKGKSL